MKIELERSVRDKVDGFFDWLEEQVNKGTYTHEAELISDFTDRIIVPALTALKSKDEKFMETIEVPKDIFVGPISQIQAQVNKSFTDMFNDLGAAPQTPAPTSKPEPEPEVQPETESKPEVQPATMPQTAPDQTRNGNGHKSTKKRDLSGAEKDAIRAHFIGADGIIEEDDLVRLKPTFPRGDELSIFQLNGFVSYLHRKIAYGNRRIIDRIDMNRYMEWMKKQVKLWAQYNSPKYETYRRKAAQQAAQTQASPMSGFKRSRQIS